MNYIRKLFEYLSKIHFSIWIALIIVFAVFRLISIFSLRDGHHVDEAWSYGFANSYYKTQVFGGFYQYEWENVGEWISSDVFNDYITVSEGERFTFDSVLYNKNLDLSPALYELLLHLVCSLFPNSFSWNYAFFINLLFYVPTLVFVYLISYQFTNSRACGLACLIYFVFSGSGTANFLYLRVYHMFTFFVLVLFWLIQKIIKNENKKNIYYWLLPIITFLGCFTHYYFFVIAFLFTCFSALLLLLKRRYVDWFRLCYVMLISVLFFFAVYSPALNMILPFTGGDAAGGYSYPYSWDLAVANRHFFTDTLGFYINFRVASLIMFLGSLIFLCIIVGLMYFLFRKESWMDNLLGLLRNKMRDCSKSFMCFAKKIDITFIVALLTIGLDILIIPYSSSLCNMGYIERYFFPVLCLFIVLYASVIGMLIKEIIISKANSFLKLSCVMLILVLLLVQRNYSKIYTDRFMFLTMNENELIDNVSNKDCYVYTSSLRDLVWLSTVLNESNNAFVDFKGEFSCDAVVFPEDQCEGVLLIVDNGFMTEEQKQEYEETDSFELNDIMRPQVMMTMQDYINNIEEKTSCRFQLINEYKTYIGDIKLYKMTE